MTKSDHANGWRRAHLREFAIVQTGVAKNSRAVVDGVERPYLRVANVQEGRLDLTTIKTVRVDPADVSRYELRVGDVLMTEGGDFDKLGRGTVWRGEIRGCLHQNHLFAVRPNPTLVVPEYLAAWSASTVGRRYFMACSKQTTNLASINSSQVKAAPLLLPALREQRAIVDFLALLDSCSVRIDTIIRVKRRFRRGLTHRLLSGAPIRDGTGRDSAVYNLSDLLTESREIASTGTHARKLTVKLYGRGVVPKSDSRGGSARTQYYRRRAGQFIYSKLDFLNGAFGIVPPELDGFESTLDLPAFDIAPDIGSRWLLHLFSWPGFYKQHVGLANGGRKARRVNPRDLLKLRIAVPPRPLQDRVAALLDACDHEIVLFEQLAGALERQKRALLDKLLSGELRLPAT